jgi:hypothetical protein
MFRLWCMLDTVLPGTFVGTGEREKWVASEYLAVTDRFLSGHAPKRVRQQR